MKKSRMPEGPSDRRQAIVDAAVACFIKEGIVQTKFSQIAKRARVHQPLISYYFPDFESLFAAVVQVLLEDLKVMSVHSIQRQQNDPRIALLDYSEIPLKWAKEKPEYNALWTFFYHLASYHPVFKGINDAIRVTGRERISLLLYRYQEVRKLTLIPGWNVQQLAYVIQTYITGATTMAVTEKAHHEEAARTCRHSIEALLDQLFRDE